MRCFHFTSWDIAEINPDKCHYAEWDKSYYWRHKLEGYWLKFIDEKLQRMFRNILDKEDVIQLGKHYKYTAELLKEYIFEEVRVNYYPNLPSRKRCMFLFDPETNINEYAALLNFDMEKYNLVEIETAEENSKMLRVNMDLLNCNLKYYNEIIAMAHEYWKGTSEISLNTEILFEGEFKILQILHSNNNAKVI